MSIQKPRAIKLENMAKLLKKVTFEYKDSIESLEGKEVRDWQREVNGFIAMTALRTGSSGISKYNWKVTKK